MDYRARLAKRLKTLRAERVWSHHDLADRAWTGRTYLARLETARQDPTLGRLRKLARALQVPVAVLLG